MNNNVSTDPEDPFLWLEDVDGERALAWVRERNAESQALLEARADFAPTRERLLAILNSNERIPYASVVRRHRPRGWVSSCQKL